MMRTDVSFLLLTLMWWNLLCVVVKINSLNFLISSSAKMTLLFIFSFSTLSSSPKQKRNFLFVLCLAILCAVQLELHRGKSELSKLQRERKEGKVLIRVCPSRQLSYKNEIRKWKVKRSSHFSDTSRFLSVINMGHHQYRRIRERTVKKYPFRGLQIPTAASPWLTIRRENEKESYIIIPLLNRKFNVCGPGCVRLGSGCGRKFHFQISRFAQLAAINFISRCNIGLVPAEKNPQQLNRASNHSINFTSLCSASTAYDF